VLELETAGGGLVLSVTPPTNLSALLTTVLAAFSTWVTTVLAKSAPGRVGSVTGWPGLAGEGMLGLEAAPLPTHGR
jgi:hypothetical protein